MKTILHTFRSFTLIEMLVVIAIISVLSAMVLPAINRAKETAKRAQCQNCLHQIGLGIQMYANDRDGMIPYARTYPWEVMGGQPDPGYLQDLLIPYCGGATGAVGKIYKCLGVKRVIDPSNSFRYNYFFANGWNVPQTARRMDRVPSPGRAVLHYDVAWDNWAYKDLPHLGIDAVYVDGHVAFVEGVYFLQNGNEQTGLFCSTGW